MTELSPELLAQFVDGLGTGGLALAVLWGQRELRDALRAIHRDLLAMVPDPEPPARTLPFEPARRVA